MTKALATRPTAPQPPALVTASLTELEIAIGGRTVLVAALSHAPKSRDLDYVLGLLGDPQYAETPIALLCARGGITAGELIEAFKGGEIARAQAVASREVGKQLAAVAEDTMRMALPSEQVCRKCDGLGVYTDDPTKKVPNPEPQPCKACNQSGRVIVDGDLEHKKLALDMGKLLSKGGGVNVQVNQQANTFVGQSAGGALERMQAATDAILYGDGVASPLAPAVVDAEVLDAPAVDAPVVEGDWREEAHG